MIARMGGAAWLLAGAALLSGCGEGGEAERAAATNAAEPKIRIANKHHDDLTALPPNLQRLAMMRAIRATGNRCQRVDNAGYQEEYRNMRMWVAVCGSDAEKAASTTKSYAVFIAANGDVQVRDCADSGTLELPRCEGLAPAIPDDSGPEFQKGAADNAFRNQF